MTRHLTILILLVISTTCFGHGSANGQSPDGSAASATGTVAGDISKMTPEQQAQFRCEQTREQIQRQLDSKDNSPSAEANLQSLRNNERTSCVPPLVEQPASAASLQPRYPMQAMRARHQGVVIVLVELAADGAVTSDSVYQSSGFRELDQAALEAVHKWHFDAAVGRSVRVPVNFSLGG